MASVKWEVGSDADVMTTELNTLTDTSQAISSAIDNSSSLYLFDDVEFHNATLSITAVSGALLELYMVLERLAGGGNYEDGDASIAPPATNLVGVFLMRAVTTAQTHVIRQIPLPPGKFKYVLVNRIGTALAASGNTLRRKPYRYQTA